MTERSSRYVKCIKYKQQSWKYSFKRIGGLASGIDRDTLIEQMTARTTSKITSKKQAMTKLEWKRDAYRSISNKIIDLQDNYLSYSATKSLKKQ